MEERRPRILGQQLRAAREGLALSVEDVLEQLGTDPHTLIDWENDVSEPPLRELWRLAELYRRSTDYFLAVTPPRPSQIQFRLTKWRSMSQLPLGARQALAQFEELCRVATHLESLAKERQRIRFSPRPQASNPEALARSERLRLGLDERPVKKLRDRLEDQGVWVFEIPVPDNAFSGFSWWHSNYGPCVLVNAREIAGRRAFTLSHEYAHLLHGSGPSVCALWASMPEERFADRFAAAFLMPDADVDREFSKRDISRVSPDIQQVRPLAHRYEVSVEAMVRKLGDIGLLDRQTAQELLASGEPKAEHLRRPKAPSWRRRLGGRYVTLATRAHAKGQLSTGKLAEYLYIDIRTAQTLLPQEQQSPTVGSNG